MRSGITSVYTEDGEHYLGQVRKDWVNYQDRPGHATSREVWFAVPEARVAHANPDGCPWFELRREAVAALRQGVTLG